MKKVAEKSDVPFSGSVEVRDYSLWTKHIHGNPELARLIERLKEDDTVTLRVGGHEGVWVKKKNGTTGIPTPGLKPVGAIRKIWFGWFADRRGDLVDIELIGKPPEVRAFRHAAGSAANVGDGDEAAWDAFLELGRAGWRLEPGNFDRSDLHERNADA